MVYDQLLRLDQLNQLQAFKNMSPVKSSLNDGQDGLSDLETSAKPTEGDISKASREEDRVTLDKLPNKSSSPKKLISPSKLVGKALLKKQTSSSSNASTGSGSSTYKKRSSWLNLLAPSYRSRSTEFHKFFGDIIPDTERLVADYSCALHREILIQGRLYVSINYLAFHSNLFSWVTKLVIRFRDISEMSKANTARFIPNAIQIITTSGDKHIFASFVARDKSYSNMMQMWQNNLMNERLTDQEIRDVVHNAYGKDLGFSDDEELSIHSPDPLTPVEDYDDEELVDLEFEMTEEEGGSRPSLPKRGSSASLTVHTNRRDEDPDDNNNQDADKRSTVSHLSRPKNAQARKSIELSPVRFLRSKLKRSEKLRQSGEVARAREKLLIDLDQDEPNQVLDLESRSFTAFDYSPAPSSAVIVDTPSPLLGDSNRTHWSKRTRKTSAPDIRTLNDLNEADPGGCSSSGPLGAKSEIVDNFVSVDKEAVEADGAGPKTETEIKSGVEDGREARPELSCGCGQHEGQMMAYEEMDIGVDGLFEMLFTESKAIQKFWKQRGMIECAASRWNDEGGRKQKDCLRAESDDDKAGDGHEDWRQIRIKQVRQLSYSMNINHMWASQVKIEEAQNIVVLKPGVYVVSSRSQNSGIPYGDTFTVDLSYCLSKHESDVNKSRLLVHCWINFKKDKNNWRLAMIKPVIEHKSLQGVQEYVSDLVKFIKRHLSEAGQKMADGESGLSRQEKAKRARREPPQRRSSAINRAKSRLKERKLKSIYKYYIESSNESDVGERLLQSRDSISDDERDSQSSFCELDSDEDRASMAILVDRTSESAGSVSALERSFSDVERPNPRRKSPRTSGRRSRRHKTGLELGSRWLTPVLLVLILLVLVYNAHILQQVGRLECQCDKPC